MQRKTITLAILAVVLISLVGAAVFKGKPATSTNTPNQASIGVIKITGAIASGSSGGGGFYEVITGSQTVIEELRQAKDDPNIKGVVLYVNSPGGTPAGALEIGNEIKRLRKAGKKVVTYMAETAASGAYWIACETDLIVANPTTLTGSIGVIMQTTDLQGLYDKLGVEQNVFKTGPYKDMGSSARDITPEEREIFQSIIDDSYQQFLEVVAKGRNMDIEQVRQLADGRVYTGRQALELGLVDQTGDFHQAIQTAAKMAGIKGEPNLVHLSTQTFWESLLGISSNLKPAGWFRFMSGPLYMPPWIIEQS